MAAPGDICYARTNDGIDIAYTAFGDGPALLFAPGFVTHLDLMWEFPAFKAMLPLVKSFRLIVLDKRGTGLSDRSLGFGSLEQRTEDGCSRRQARAGALRTQRLHAADGA